jgi:hypothetical protein
MPNKDPFNYELLTYVYVIVLSAFGGLASYIQKMKSGYCRFSLTEMAGELFISGFVGFITFNLCLAAQIENFNYISVLIGLSSHMGSKAIMLIEKIIFNKMQGMSEIITIKEENED